VQSKKGILLVKRGAAPFEGRCGLPGGVVEDDGTVEQAAVREALEETGLRIESLRLVGVYSKPGRGPRGRSITVVYAARAVWGETQIGKRCRGHFRLQPLEAPGTLPSTAPRY